MEESFSKLEEHSYKIIIKKRYSSSNQQIFTCNYHIISENDSNNAILLRMKHLKFMIIKQKGNYIIACFDKTVLIFEQTSIKLLEDIVSKIDGLTIYLFTKTNIFSQKEETLLQIEFDILTKKEIYNFVDEFYIDISRKHSIYPIRKDILLCFSGYLIKQSYYKIRERQKNIIFSSKNCISCKKSLSDDEYIILRTLGYGSSTKVDLIYLIEADELMVKKTPNGNLDEESKLTTREMDNYLKINYALLPKLYYKFDEENFILIQFIEGNTLSLIQNLQLNFEDKIQIIFQIMMIINYLHQNGFVYRDLKPNNIIIDDNKTIFLIDFDRMIELGNISNDQKFTCDLQDTFAAPEVNLGQIKYENDIYSVGQMIYFIINEKNPNTKEQIDVKSFENNLKLFTIYQQCTKKDLKQRPSISDLMFDFYLNFSSFLNKPFIHKDHTVEYFHDLINNPKETAMKDINKSIHLMSIASDQNFSTAQHFLGYIYYNGKYVAPDIAKSIHYFTLAANQNHLQSQFNLGGIYFNGLYIERDIQKSIYYFTLAANQNHVKAQYHLGLFYYEGEYIKKDIQKGIYYLSLAADQKYLDALYQLGLIYYEGECIPRNINKSIYYLSLASDQNYVKAQFCLGIIYSEEKYHFDINKSIHYYTLAADQNHPDSQNNLGTLYYEGKYITRDINKAIYYYSLASNNNIPQAQYNLGLIYYQGIYVTQNINKSIFYLSLAAEQNIQRAQFNLGFIYSEGKSIKLDITKGIYYYSLAANQNDSNAQLNLGVIYYEGKYISRDIKKAIHYLTLASNQNNFKAQIKLGIIYLEGKYIERSVDKAIYYFSLASRENNFIAQFYLGLIYYEIDDEIRDIKKSIYYFQLAAKQNHVEANLYLGIIYSEGDDTIYDINKSIYYFQLAAKQNHVDAQFYLGIIYYKYKQVRDIKKAIHYFQLASKQNHVEAQLYLGLIYYNGKYITRDIYKSIYYYSLASDQNNPEAQNNLGAIYYENRFIPCDIKKSINYFMLSSNQNFSDAQNNLGVIYYTGKHVHKNIEKSIHYLMLAANQNNVKAQMNLGGIFFEGKNIKADINKSIYYFSLAAKLDNKAAQYNLGIFYLTGFHIEKNINKGIDLLIQSSKGCAKANFTVGYLYHEGKYIKRDINKSIYHYKEASSFNIQYAKNNLGIIYKNGIGNEIPKNIQLAIEYFREAVNRQNDKLSLYNLSHIYIFEFCTENEIEDSIKMLIRSSSQNFDPANELLIIALIKKHGFNLNNIQQDLINKTDRSSNLPFTIRNLMKLQCIFNEDIFQQKYQYLKTQDYLYDFLFNAIPTIKLNKESVNQQSNIVNNNITRCFYDGFGMT